MHHSPSRRSGRPAGGGNRGASIARLASIRQSVRRWSGALPRPSPGRGFPPFQALVDAAESGAVLTPAPGTYAGPVVIDKPLTIDGAGQVTIDGGGKGTVVLLETNGATLKGLRITNSGNSHNDIDCGSAGPRQLQCHQGQPDRQLPLRRRSATVRGQHRPAQPHLLQARGTGHPRRCHPPLVQLPQQDHRQRHPRLPRHRGLVFPRQPHRPQRRPPRALFPALHVFPDQSGGGQPLRGQYGGDLPHVQRWGHRPQ